MRPYLVLCAVVLMAVAAFGQQPVPPRFFGPCVLGCGPFVPLITTPMASLQDVSPNPAGATNATTGLVAGATNSTLSQLSGSTSSVYTVPVWYQGGAPLITPQVHLWPEPVGGEMHPTMHPMMEQRHGEHAKAQWVYFSGTEYTVAAVDASSAAKSGKKASRTYGNADVERQNQSNGTVKYSGKTEKM
jgi:hypothetical protein